MSAVLYIEDNPDNRLLVDRLLSAYDYTVTAVADGHQALEYVQTHQPDIILIDINLPGLDGYATTQRLRQNSHLNQTPIVALTANVMQGDREKALAAGCTGYIQKPIDVDRFPDQIQQFILADRQ